MLALGPTKNIDYMVFDDSLEVNGLVKMTSISLQNGETITNSTNGDVAISGNILGTQKVYTVISDSVLTAAQAQGGLWVARPIAGKYQATLPAAAPGLTLEFMVADADTLRIKAATGDSLLDSSGAAFMVYGSVAGTVKVTAIDTVRWVLMHAIGTWTGSIN
jgi:hypothetical protein